MRYNYPVKMVSNRQSGFSLVETYISIALFVLVIIAVGAFQAGIFSNQRVVTGSFQTAQDAQIILKTLLTELRSAAPGTNGAYSLVSAGTSSIMFFSDTNGDGKTEQIGYTLLQNTLYRTSIPPTGTPPVYVIANQSTTSIMTNIKNSTSTPIFQYFDQFYTGTSSPLSLPIDLLSVRLIRINLTLDVDPRISPAPRTYTVQVGLRNLKTNL